MLEGPLNGRIALVTGASRGIGRAAALGLAQAGAHVIISGRSLPQLESLDDEIQAAGAGATLLQLDLRKGDKLDQLGPTLYQRWQKLDILIANAGILGPLSPLGRDSIVILCPLIQLHALVIGLRRLYQEWPPPPHPLLSSSPPEPQQSLLLLPLARR